MKEEGREKQAVALKQILLLIGKAEAVNCRRKRQKVLVTKAEVDFQISTIDKELYALLLKNNNLEKTPSCEKKPADHILEDIVLLVARLLPEDHCHHLGNFQTLV